MTKKWNAPYYHGPPLPVLSAGEMAAVDALAMSRGLSLLQMMENAGSLLARAARICLAQRAPGRGPAADTPSILVLAGGGGNGGGALAAARRLAGHGYRVTAISSVADSRQIPATRRQSRLFRAVTGQPVANAGAVRDAAGRIRLPPADLLLDGLFGYSLRGAPRGIAQELIAAARHHSASVLAVDLPSGLNPDRGTAPDEVISADMTLTLVLPKRGLLTASGPELAGRILLGDIGIPPAWTASAVPAVQLGNWYRDGDLQWLPPN